MEKKKCTKCGVEKLIEYFGKCSRVKSKLMAACKDCVNRAGKEYKKKKQDQRMLCTVENCSHIIKAGNKYCNRHQLQLNRFGRILERTIHDPNPILVTGDLARMTLLISRPKKLPKILRKFARSNGVIFPSLRRFLARQNRTIPAALSSPKLPQK
jgi:hypothetical protein